MLLNLVIKNFITIDFLEISFTEGLNIITGESGSGKSVILKAIDLATGAKASPDMIRKGASVAWVECEFQSNSKTAFLFKEFTNESDTFTIRREILASGRSRTFLNDQTIPLTKLKENANYLTEYVSQNQASCLQEESFARKILDSYASLTTLQEQFSTCFTQVSTLSKEIDCLLHKKEQANAEVSQLREDVSSIESMKFQEEEEAALEQELTLLTTAKERLQISENINHVLIEQSPAILLSLKTLKKDLDLLHKMDTTCEGMLPHLDAAVVELEELSYQIRSYKSSLDIDPQRLTQVEERLKEIDSLKKQFGPSCEDISRYLQQAQKKIDFLEESDHLLLSCERKKDSLKAELDNLGALLSSKRKEAAIVFQQKVSEVLKKLNLTNASFEVHLEKIHRSSFGEEKISLLFSANRGIDPQPITYSASGGELSRVMLAIKTVLAKKDDPHTIIFDEIDSNVGGQSALIIGENLKKLADYQQVICVTHFVQVARFANNHLCVQKKENALSTTIVHSLSPESQEKEFLRMVGQNYDPPLLKKGK
ncbi:MAG: hypothetical protein COT84_03435 [Chlamydiae bacterium CG10_big_fil_rev_8_21_14_0_10_35_9]|nr:MAG: hypothetical protein COT84_03435 [Chlamydiae bacterium CG10_big_fil_rev_8_21_14_0_10_35_9]